MSTDKITASQFNEANGVDDWRYVLGAVQTVYRTDNFSVGTEFIGAIADAADAADHHPDVDLRYGTVQVRLSSHDIGAVSQRDVELARTISSLARERGLAAGPQLGQELEVAVDVLDVDRVRPFWKAVLGYRELDEDALTDPLGHGPDFWFQQMDEPRTDRNRIHLDVSVPHDAALERIDAAVAAGGHVVSDDRAPAFWVLADPEGNEACICTWQARD